MQKIRILDDAAINKIAAGEVVADPASVVKELVENSLDAKASRITIAIRGGGRFLIRIIDDGEGMSEDDAVLAFERHATSKIHSFEDLSSLDTMGFRGEALPSIAAVSKCTVLTSPRGSDTGTLVVFEGGRMVAVKKTAATSGTDISVKDLFFNVPARKKFQKSPQQEFLEIVKTVKALSLSHPLVHFRLTHNDAEVLDTQKAEIVEGNKLGSLKNRLPVFFENGIDWLELSIKNEERALEGYLSSPFHSKANRTGQCLFVNGRYVVSPFVSEVIREAFGSSLEERRYPSFVLHLQLPPDTMDVNVHPQKKEIRFRHLDDLRSFLGRAVRDALQPLFHPQEKSLQEKSLLTASFPTVPFSLENTHEEKKFSDWACFFSDEKELLQAPKLVESPLFHQTELPLKEIATPKVLACRMGYFFVDGWQGGWVVLNQRRALSRIFYERAGAKIKAEAQMGLMTQSLELTPEELCLIEGSQECLDDLGLFVEGSTLFSKTVFSKSLREVFESLFQEKRLNWTFSFRKETRLSLEEGQLILEALLATQEPYFDPKGRPVFAPLDESTLKDLYDKKTNKEHSKPLERETSVFS